PKINGNAYARNLNISSPLNIESGNLIIYGISNLNNRINVNNSNLNIKGNSSVITGGNATNPNPFSEVLTVTSEDKATVHFYDMSRKMVGSHALVKGSNVLNPAALKPG